MATQRKKDANLKEKIGTSPTPIKTKKSSAATATTNPSSDKKQVPNYLKHTICSSSLVDHPNLPPKKQGISFVKPNISRRRSFDKPPSSSSSPIHSKSPHTTFRSPSPVLSKINSLPKPHVKKILQPSSSAKTNMAVKQIFATVKEETNGKESEKVPTEVESSKKEDEAFSVSELKEEEKPTDINNNELINSEVHVAENHNICEDVKQCNLDDRKEYVVDVETEEVGDKVVVEEVITENFVEKKEEKKNMETEGVHKDGEEGDKMEEDKIEIAKDDALEVNDDVVKIGENIEIALKEEKQKGDINEEGKGKKGEQINNDLGNTSGKEAQQQVQYNDVIEETKNKLLEKRKNKVKALVGAFETVISLQEPDP